MAISMSGSVSATLASKRRRGGIVLLLLSAFCAPVLQAQDDEGVTLVVVGIPQSASLSALPGAAVSHKLTLHNVYTGEVTWSHAGCGCAPSGSSGCNATSWWNGSTCRPRQWACYDHGMGAHIARRCVIDVDECASKPCKNGAACMDSMHTQNIPAEQYSCGCMQGYSDGMCVYDFNGC